MKYGSIVVSSLKESRILKRIASLTVVTMMLFSTMVSTGVFTGVAVAAGEPVVTITAQPDNPTNETTATFTFTADPAADTFSCRLDAGTWDPCTSPLELVGLAEGAHTLDVNGTNGNGTGLEVNVAWEIDLTPPDTIVYNTPTNPSTDSTPTFNFYSNDGNATFECSIDGGVYAACTNPYTISPLAVGIHDFDIRAIDLAGNVDSTPSTYQWEITEADNRVITDCEELQDINNSPSTIGGTYTLANDIDCSMTNPSDESFDLGGTWGDGYGFLPIGTSNGGFSGYFDGQGFTINNLFIDRYSSRQALFSEINEDGTVVNLNFNSPSVTGGSSRSAILAGENNGYIDSVNITDMYLEGNDSVGGIAGESYNDVNDVHVSGQMISNGDESGGLFGYFDGATLSNCSFSGDITSEYESGGIVGENEDDSTIHRCYSEGSISATSTDTGGIIGEVEAEMTITESFSTMDVTGTSSVGGLVGAAYDTITISDSYFNGTVTGDDVGAVIGHVSSSYDTSVTNTYGTGLITPDGDEYGGFISTFGDNTFVNNFWDKQTTGQELGCDDTEVCPDILGKTSSEMKSINTFTTELGGSSWDFESIWGIDPSVNGGYPCLRWSPICDELDGVSGEIEQNAPNNGDANGDGQADSDQNNVTSLVSVISGKYVSLQTECGQIIPDNSNVSTLGESTEHQDPAYQYTAGLISFTVNDCDSNAAITQFFYGDFDLSTITPRKYNSVTHTYTTIPGATMTKEVIGGQKVLKITYSIADNGPLDEDASIGTIKDPSGPAFLAVGVPNTGLK